MSTDVIGFSTARKTTRAGLINTWLDTGTLKLYDGSRPASADTAVSTQTLLATFTMKSPAGTVTNGVFTATAPDPALVISTGTKTAAWARAADSSAVTIGDFDVGLAGSGAALILDNLSLTEGGLVALLSFTLTEG